MLYKPNSYLKTISFYRRILGFYILLCISTSVQSDDSKDNYSYIDCSIKSTELNDKSYENNIYSSYRLDTKNSKITIYYENINEYTDICSSKCIVTDDSFTLKNNFKYKDVDIAFDYAVNRWTGKFEGSSTSFQRGKILYKFYYNGECKSGISKLKIKPKF